MIRKLTLLVFWSAVCALPIFAAVHSPSLDDRLAALKDGETYSVILFLDSRLTMDEVYPVALTLPMTERREYVVKTLKQRFHDMSDHVMPHLEQARKEGHVTLLRPLWILNAVRLTATRSVIEDIDQNYREVVYIAADPVFPNTLDNAGWGVTDMQAPRTWTQFGNGTGVIVGHKDSGTDLNHPGYVGRHWVNPGEDLNHDGIIQASEINGVDDDHNGYVDDFYGWDFDDDVNNVNDRDSGHHGTQTGSNVTAAFTPCDTVCAAPGAKLMELTGYYTQGATWEASQYAIEMGANIITQSVSFKHSECNDNLVWECPNYVAHRIVSEMELAAGLLHSNSTGNAGQSNAIPFSAAAPSNCPPPAMLPGHPEQGGVSSMIGVSAYTSTGDWASFSGRGPSAWSRQDICINPRMPFCGEAGRGNAYPAAYEDYPYHDGALRGLLKPDVSGPGVGIPVLAYGGGCTSNSGTSFSAPLVAAACAAIYSAFPGITPENAYRMLMNGALDAGPVGPDSLFGFGKIRPFRACSLYVNTTGFVRGTVTYNGSTPLSGVRVSSDNVQTVVTDQNGNYRIALAAGMHTLAFESYGYADDTEQFVVTGGQIVTRDVAMFDAGHCDVTFAVDGYGQPLNNMPVSIPEIPLDTVTGPDGTVSLTIFAGHYDVHVGTLPWADSTRGGDFNIGQAWVPFSLVRSPRAWPTGPDHHGYFIYDNYDAAGRCDFNWLEINPNLGGLGSPLSTGDDGKVTVTLPFTYRFYGHDYTQITVSANGFIQMGAVDSNEYTATPIPCIYEPNGFLAPWFYDWDLGGGHVDWYSQPDSHRVIVEWYNVIEYLHSGNATFEAILYDPAFVVTPTGDGIAKFQYDRMDRAFEGTVGIENEAGSDGVQYVYMRQYDPHASQLAVGRALLVTTELLDAASPVPAALPTEFTLHPNFPNPFNPSTTFIWSAPRAARVRLALYDILGREAAVIFDGWSVAGENAQHFNASRLASGLYFARLTSAGRALAVQKVVLMK